MKSRQDASEIEEVVKSGHEGFVLWFTGMSGAGKTTISCMLRDRLRAAGARVELLDGDIVRTRLGRDLGFSKADRDENIRRIGFVAELLSRNGTIVIVAAISPYRDLRDEVRAQVNTFVEVHVFCPLEVLITRDVKGLYRRALAGELSDFTGVSSPYEPPLIPEISIDTSIEIAEGSAARVWGALKEMGLLEEMEGR